VRQAPSAAPQNLADVKVEQEFIDEVRLCLSAAWLSELDADDLRFPLMDGQGIQAWLEPQPRASQLSGLAHGLCLRLIAANRATWSKELADIALHAIDQADRRPGSSEAKIRRTNMFLARYGGADGQTLLEVGEAFALTREQVRQICEAILS
jgi:hypothetical protein